MHLHFASNLYISHGKRNKFILFRPRKNNKNPKREKKKKEIETPSLQILISCGVLYTPYKSAKKYSTPIKCKIQASHWGEQKRTFSVERTKKGRKKKKIAQWSNERNSIIQIHKTKYKTDFIHPTFHYPRKPTSEKNNKKKRRTPSLSLHNVVLDLHHAHVTHKHPGNV